MKFLDFFEPVHCVSLAHKIPAGTRLPAPRSDQVSSSSMDSILLQHPRAEIGGRRTDRLLAVCPR